MHRLVHISMCALLCAPAVGACYNDITFEGSSDVAAEVSDTGVDAKRDGGDASANDGGADTSYDDGGDEDTSTDIGSDVEADGEDVAPDGSDSGECSEDQHDGGDGQCVSMGECSASFHDGGDGVCVALDSCSTGYHDGGDSVCVPTDECSAGYHDGGDGTCFGAGTCAELFHDGGNGACVASNACSVGYRDGGDGVCVAANACSTGYRDGGAGVCVPSNVCSAGYHDGGDGVCVASNACRPGYHDGGDGVCVPTDACSAGYHDGGDGACLAEGTCIDAFHDGGDGACLPIGACASGYEDGGCGTCVATDRPSLPFAAGSGSPTDPYVICSAEQLMSIGETISLLDASYVLGDDLDLTGIDVNMIGGETPELAFTGEFDGAGHTISNMLLNVEGPRLATGLFVRTHRASIHDLTLENATVVAAESENVGALVGTISIGSRVFSNHVSGYVGGATIVGGVAGLVECVEQLEDLSASTEVVASSEAGGLFGRVGSYGGCELDDPYIIGCSADGAVTAGEMAGGLIGHIIGGANLVSCDAAGDVAGGRYVGGMIGMAEDAKFRDSHASGTVVSAYASTDTWCTGGSGGLVGVANSVLIDASTASGDVIGPDGPCVGGLIGGAPNAVIINSSASGNVEGRILVGGLVGMLASEHVFKSYSTGSATGDQMVGGLVGRMDADMSNSSLSDVWASGAVVTASDRGGGLVGENFLGTIQRSYATGSVSGSGTNLGGLVGLNTGDIEDSYWDVDTSGHGTGGGATDGSDGGLGYHTADMKRQSTYVGFSFPDQWVLPVDAYPQIVPLPPLVIVSISFESAGVEGGQTLVITASGLESGVTATAPCEPDTLNFISSTEVSCTIAARGYPDTVALRLISAEGRISNPVPFHYTCEPAFAGGDGTVGNPYLIATTTQMAGMSCRLDAAFKLSTDISLASAAHIFPLNDSEHPFTGVFDGNGRSLRNLPLSLIAGSYHGIFHSVSGATIYDLNLDGVVADDGTVFGTFAPLANTISDSTVENVHVTGSIDGHGNLSGLVERASRTDVIGCSFVGTLHNTGGWTSGLVGRGSGTLRGSWVDVDLRGVGSAGGLIGWLDPGAVVEQCYALGSVGEVGPATKAGGLVGIAQPDTTIRDSYSLANVSASTTAAGIAFYGRGEIATSYFAGTLSGAGVRHPIVSDVGTGEINVSQCYFDVSVSGVGTAGEDDPHGGTGYDTAGMWQQATYEGFDFAQTWVIDEGNDYPHCAWEP